VRKMPLGQLSAEFVVIVVGVLVALAVDQWRESVGARAAEAQYVSRLIDDLTIDSLQSERFIEAGAAKAAALAEVMDALDDSAAVRLRPSTAWPDMNFTYTRPPPQTTTFDELRNTGGLGLIRSDDLRFEIGNTYRLLQHHYERLEDRRTRIAFTVAELFPSASWGLGTTPDLSSAQIDSAFYATPDSGARLQRLMSAEYRGLLNQERIYARSMEAISRQMLDLTVGLLEGLRAYQSTLR